MANFVVLTNSISLIFGSIDLYKIKGIILFNDTTNFNHFQRTDGFFPKLLERNRGRKAERLASRIGTSSVFPLYGGTGWVRRMPMRGWMRSTISIPMRPRSRASMLFFLIQSQGKIRAVEGDQHIRAPGKDSLGGLANAAFQVAVLR